MNQKIRQQLFLLQDKKYQAFHSSLCPGINNIIGVRVPEIRKLVKNILKENYTEYLETVENEYYEETLIEGLIIAMCPLSFENKIEYLDSFIKKINNWAICDIVCSSFKLSKEEEKSMWTYLKKYYNSDNEFELRFLIVMMINNYLTDDYSKNVIQIIESVNKESYYVKMSIAWLISILYIKNKTIVIDYLENNNLDTWTYNKSIQKIIESKRVSNQEKELLKKKKRKTK